MESDNKTILLLKEKKISPKISPSTANCCVLQNSFEGVPIVAQWVKNPTSIS